MKQQIHPAVLVAVIVVVVGLVGFFFYRGTATPAAVPMDPLGPAGKLLKAGGGMHGKTPDVQQTTDRPQSTQPFGGGGK